MKIDFNADPEVLAAKFLGSNAADHAHYSQCCDVVSADWKKSANIAYLTRLRAAIDAGYMRACDAKAGRVVKVDPKVLPESRQVKMKEPRRPLKQLHGFDMESVAQRVIALMSKPIVPAAHVLWPR